MVNLSPSSSFERNSRLSVATVKNRAEQKYLHHELENLEKEKKTALKILQNDKQCFKLKYSKSNNLSSSSLSSSTQEILSKYFVPLTDMNLTSLSSFNEDALEPVSSTISSVDFQEIRNMLFTNNEIDKEKILCLHLISAHRTESLTPSKKKLAYMCKIHSPLERLLERSKRKHIHLEQRMTNMLPIYTLEFTEFGLNSQCNDLINDGRLAARILLNEKVRELINSVLNALRQSNPEKNYEIFEMANDIGCLKKLFTKRKILDFLEILMNSSLIDSCESFVLTAPFRVKSIQLEIRTITGTLENLVKQIRQNVLQIPTRTRITTEDDSSDHEEVKQHFRKSSSITFKSMSLTNKDNNEDKTSKDIEDLYSNKSSNQDQSDPEKKMGRHVKTNYLSKNRAAAANAKKVEYDSDDGADYYHRPKRASTSSSSNRSRRSSGQQGSVTDRPNLQPIKIPEEVNAIMVQETPVDNNNKPDEASVDQIVNSREQGKESPSSNAAAKDNTENACLSAERRKSSNSDTEHIKIHLKQTTCPACMERYKIPLPTPKTPRIKPASVIPTPVGENPDLKTNSKNRISMLINKEMFKLQSYERRFSSDDNSRRNSTRKKELETCSSSYMNLSPLELARIEQEIKEKETQKKLEKFLKE